MDWFALIFGMVLGSCVTTALVWFQQRSLSDAGRARYFSRLALSVVMTSLVIGIVWAGIDYFVTGQLSISRLLFASGWMIGGLLSGWIVTGPMRRT